MTRTATHRTWRSDPKRRCPKTRVTITWFNYNTSIELRDYVALPVGEDYTAGTDLQMGPRNGISKRTPTITVLHKEMRREHQGLIARIKMRPIKCANLPTDESMFSVLFNFHTIPKP